MMKLNAGKNFSTAFSRHDPTQLSTPRQATPMNDVRSSSASISRYNLFNTPSDSKPAKNNEVVFVPETIDFSSPKTKLPLQFAIGSSNNLQYLELGKDQTKSANITASPAPKKTLESPTFYIDQNAFSPRQPAVGDKTVNQTIIQPPSEISLQDINKQLQSESEQDMAFNAKLLLEIIHSFSMTFDVCIHDVIQVLMQVQTSKNVNMNHVRIQLAKRIL